MENNQTNQPSINKKEKSGTRIFMILSILLATISGFLAYQLFNQKEIIKTQIVEIEKKTSEYDLAKQELSDLKIRFDSLITDNKELQSQLDAERAKIAELEQMIEKYKGDAVALNKARRELQTIRGLIKSYLRQIDSLNTANQTLVAEKAAVQKNLENERNVNKQLSEEKEALNQKVVLGAKLKTFNLTVTAINEKGKREVETTRSRKTDKIKCCFTIAENNIAKPGERVVYMKITGPDGHVFANGSDEQDMFFANGQKQPYSAKKTINYDGKNTDICMAFSKTSDFLEGRYKIEIYCEEVLIGASTLDLK
jgi:predicted  nucleic acid-binding Zn-ribbon protein